MVNFTENFKELKFDKNELSPFSYPEYLKTKSDEFGWIFNKEFMIPVFFSYENALLFKFKKAMFTEKVYCSRTFDEKEESFFLNEVVVLLKGLKVDLINKSSANGLTRVYPSESLECFFGTYKIDLAKDLEQIWKEFHSKHRNVIRKAEKEGVVICSGVEYLQDAYSLYKNTYAKQNRSHLSRTVFQNEVMENIENVKIYVSYYNDVPQSSGVFFYSKYASYYLHGGLCDGPKTGANNLLHWYAIKEMKENRVTFYDFMGARVDVDKKTKLYGVQSFKARFCIDMEKGYLWKMVLNKKRYNFNQFMRFAKSFIRRKPMPKDAIDEERKKGHYNI